jgi:hypothetical protein
MTGCGSSSQNNQGSTTKETLESAAQEKETQRVETAAENPETESVETESEPVEASVLVETVDDIKNVYQFELQGEHYQLPCTLDDFLENGCTISDDYLSCKMEGQSYMNVEVYPVPGEDSYIKVMVINDSDEERTVNESQEVVGIDVRSTASDIDLRINGGNLKVTYDDAFSKALKSLYGEDETIYSSYTSNNGDDHSFEWRFYKSVDPELASQIAIEFQSITKGKDRLRFEQSGEAKGTFTMEYWPK